MLDGVVFVGDNVLRNDGHADRRGGVVYRVRTSDERESESQATATAMSYTLFSLQKKKTNYGFREQRDETIYSKPVLHPTLRELPN